MSRNQISEGDDEQIETFCGKEFDQILAFHRPFTWNW